MSPILEVKQDIGQAVVVDIADSYAAAVVEIAKEEAVLEFSVFNLVDKIDSGILLQLEQGNGPPAFAVTGQREEGNGHDRYPREDLH